MSREEMEQEDLYDEVREAYEAANNLQEEEAEETSLTEQRIELEKEIKDGEEAAPVAKKTGEEGTQTQHTPAWNEDKPPQSWSATAREKWGTIPEELRREIVRREEAAVAGVRQLHEKLAPAEGFLRGMEPFINEARQHGVPPEQYIGQVMQSERILRTAAMPQKFEEIVRIAEQYGIPLRQIVNQSVGKEMLKPPQQAQPVQLPPEVQREIMEMRQWRENMSMTAVTNEVTAFGQEKPHFEAVRNTMADLIESGAAKDLHEAYEKACWLEPNVRAALINEQQNGQRQQRAAAAATTSIPDSGSVSVDIDDDSEDTADIVRKAFYSQQTGRM